MSREFDDFDFVDPGDVFDFEVTNPKVLEAARSNRNAGNGSNDKSKAPAHRDNIKRHNSNSRRLRGLENKAPAYDAAEWEESVFRSNENSDGRVVQPSYDKIARRYSHKSVHGTPGEGLFSDTTEMIPVEEIERQLAKSGDTDPKAHKQERALIEESSSERPTEPQIGDRQVSEPAAEYEAEAFCDPEPKAGTEPLAESKADIEPADGFETEAEPKAAAGIELISGQGADPEPSAHYQSEKESSCESSAENEIEGPVNPAPRIGSYTFYYRIGDRLEPAYPLEDGVYPDEYYEDQAYGEDYPQDYEADGSDLDGPYEDAPYADDIAAQELADQAEAFDKKAEKKAKKAGGRSKKADKRSEKKVQKSAAKAQKPGKNKAKGSAFARVLAFLKDMTPGERIVASTGALVLILAIATALVFNSSRNIKSEIDSFSELGVRLDGLAVAGTSGLLALTDAQTASITEVLQEIEETEESEESEEPLGSVIKLSLTSVQKDLKIKFQNEDGGRLISDIPFKVEVKGPGKTNEYEDDDRDGIIYKKDLAGGEYTVTILEIPELSGYDYPRDPQKVTVKEKIEYKKIDVKDEIKKESQINVGQEDTAVQQAEQAPALQDTVEWVESTQTVDPNQQAIDAEYTPINKNDIPDPSAGASRASFDALSLRVADRSLMVATEEGAQELPPVQGDQQEQAPQENELDPVDTTDTDSSTGNETTAPSDQGDAGNQQGNELDQPPQENEGETGQDKKIGISLSRTTLELELGDRVKLEAHTENYDGQVEWKSSDDGIVTVDGGHINALASGRADITASISSGGSTAKAICSVSVKGNEIIVNFPVADLKLSVGDETHVEPEIKNTRDAKVIFSAEDPSIIEVTYEGLKAKIRAIKAGSTNLNLEVYDDGRDHLAQLKVTVGTTNAREDTVTKLKDKSGRQVYIKDAQGNYIEAVLADYYKYDSFFTKNSEEAKNYTGWQEIGGVTYYFDKSGNPVTGTQVIQGARYEFNSDGSLKTDSKTGLMGIDVSKWNGSIDWSSVKKSGVHYAIIRCGYRGSATGVLVEDPKFRENIAGARNAGIKVGVYFFTQAINEVEAVEEASMVLSQLGGQGLSFPVFIDVESSGGRADGLDRASRTAVVNAFCQTIQNGGYRAGIYANKTWFESKMNTGSLTGYKIWLAQYISAPTYTATRYDMWQYTSKGTVSGIKGSVDMNLSYLGL